MPGSASTPFAEYLLTLDGRKAEPWQIAALGGIEWPPGYEPRPGAYARLRAQLVACWAETGDDPPGGM